MNKRQAKKYKRKYNKRLIERFPFLLIRNRWTDEAIAYPYDCNELDFIPASWRSRFGINICEEIREELINHDCLYDYRILQIKEKFGKLQWHGNAEVGKIKEIIDRYISLSEKTCIVCGSQKDDVEIRNDFSRIRPLCDYCHRISLERKNKSMSRIKKLIVGHSCLSKGSEWKWYMGKEKLS